MKKNQPWEGQSKHALYSKVLFPKVEIRELKKINSNLEKEIKALNRSLGTEVTSRQKLVDLRVTHNGVKDELRSANAKIALMKKEASARRAAAKDEETGAVATLKLQHQKTLNDEAFKFKKLEIDLGAERKIRVAVEAELTEAKKTVSKLRGQIDNLTMQQAKTDKSLSTMAAKAKLKQQQQLQRYSHSNAVIDLAIQKKGRGQKKGVIVVRGGSVRWFRRRTSEWLTLLFKSGQTERVGGRMFKYKLDYM